MKNLILHIFIFILTTSSLYAQEKDAGIANDIPAMPTPLDDEVLDWLIGEWQGNINNASASVATLLKYEYTLDNQYVAIFSKSVINGINYQGKGAMTLKPHTKEVIGFWSDNRRGLYKGKGSIDNDMLKMIWYSAEGNTTRIIKKIDKNKFLLLISISDKDGKIDEQSIEFIRIRDLTSEE